MTPQLLELGVRGVNPANSVRQIGDESQRKVINDCCDGGPDLFSTELSGINLFKKKRKRRYQTGLSGKGKCLANKKVKPPCAKGGGRGCREKKV